LHTSTCGRSVRVPALHGRISPELNCLLLLWLAPYLCLPSFPITLMLGTAGI
jgi:hypothetical protein